MPLHSDNTNIVILCQHQLNEPSSLWMLTLFTNYLSPMLSFWFSTHHWLSVVILSQLSMISLLCHSHQTICESHYFCNRVDSSNDWFHFWVILSVFHSYPKCSSLTVHLFVSVWLSLLSYCWHELLLLSLSHPTILLFLFSSVTILYYAFHHYLPSSYWSLRFHQSFLSVSYAVSSKLTDDSNLLSHSLFPLIFFLC